MSDPKQPAYLSDPLMNPFYLQAATEQARADAQVGIHNNTWALFSDARALYNVIHDDETRKIAARDDSEADHA